MATQQEGEIQQKPEGEIEDPLEAEITKTENELNQLEGSGKGGRERGTEKQEDKDKREWTKNRLASLKAQYRLERGQIMEEGGKLKHKGTVEAEKEKETVVGATTTTAPTSGTTTTGGATGKGNQKKY